MFIVSGDGVARQFQLFSSSKTFIEYEDIEQVNIKRTIFQRIFGIGDIIIESAAEDAAGVTFHDVSNPDAAEEVIRRKMDSATSPGADSASSSRADSAGSPRVDEVGKGSKTNGAA
jgi:uncharacterized membrane protein YdbT with pleckstrin-like domain